MPNHERILSEADIPADPMSLFASWFQDAHDAQLVEPAAMTLATATPDGMPSARIVLLRGFDERGFVFFTNYESHKAGELAANPHAALVLLWAPLQRQIRIEGIVEKTSEAESDEYFAKRPQGHRLGAFASPQSQVIPSREFLEIRLAELEAQYPPGSDVPRPPNWGGYRVTPSQIEFWQGRRNRLHDRLRWRKNAEGGWTRERLAP
jgi:pyridoxamine 5'-phosphate oxidase